jgi:hypothetical protein
MRIPYLPFLFYKRPPWPEVGKSDKVFVVYLARVIEFENKNRLSGAFA